MNIYFQTLGCRLNEAELETWSSQFRSRGYGLAQDATSADLVVLNTCSVTGEADRKSRKLIRRLQRDNPDSRLVVTGCYASLQAKTVKTDLGVDLVVSNEAKDDLVDRVIDELELEPAALQQPTDSSLFARGRHRAFIKVQDGCRYRCTYCIVTVARGEERSRLQSDIIDEIRRHHEQGVQEVVITGVHVGGYGSDTGSNLYELLSEILDQTGIPRIRLASVEPWDLPEHFFKLFQDKRLMPHMHLPLQSGSDSVLRRMARRCKTAEFERLADKARSEIPLFNITTDLIVGFPGETEQEWRETMAFVERVGFGHMHIFSYSPREGTKAAGLPNPVDRSTQKARSLEMHELARLLKQQELARQLGHKQAVLWENCSTEGSVWQGYTTNYHRVVLRSHTDLSGKLGNHRIESLDAASGHLVAHDPLSSIEIN